MEEIADPTGRHFLDLSANDEVEEIADPTGRHFLDLSPGRHPVRVTTTAR